ncbi:probable cytochrome P450 313a4 [Uranotaenia lowii]|uniref:probable cytochrome P450 313a4 n=1 Tax=Uranotaenia lowii TaxID=190385 RepID=UPI0024798D15|nr:probable cytochrome P450 313a4 [Uranotaenia lowii]
MFSLILIFVAVSSFSYYWHFRRSRRRFYELAAKIPGPFDWPLIGSIHLGFGQSATGICEYMLQFLHTVPTPMRAWLGPHLFMVFDDPEHLAVILNSQHCLRKSFFYKFFGLRDGLLTAEPHLWRKLRRHLNPSFSLSNLQSFIPTFNEKSNILAKRLEPFLDKGEFNILPFMGELSLSISTVTTLGLDLDKDTSECRKNYKENADHLFTLRWSRIYKAWFHLDFIYKLSTTWREEKARSKVFEQMSKKVKIISVVLNYI